MKTKFFFKLIALLILFLTFGCRNEIDSINNEKSENTEYRDPKAKTLQELNNPILNAHLPKTLINVRNILDDYFKNENSKIKIDKNKFEIDTLNIYELKRNSYLFNIKNLNFEKSYYPYLISLELTNDSNNNFSNKISIFKDSQTDVFEFDNQGKILKKTKKGSLLPTARGGCSCSSSGTYYATPTPTPGGITPFYASGGAPADVIIQFAYQTGNWSLLSYFGIINYNNSAPCPEEICEIYYNPPVTANHTTSDLSIPNPNDTNFTSFNSYYPYYYPSIKDLISAYYSKVFVPQINSFVTSSTTTYNDHIKKQTFINSFFYWLYDLTTKNPQLDSYLKSNPNALEKVFNLFAELNLNNSEKIYIGSPFPEGNILNIISTHLFSDTSIFQQYVNNQITKDQFMSYYNNALDFTSNLSGYQNYWIDQNWEKYNNILSYILLDYNNRKNFGLQAISFLSDHSDFNWLDFKNLFFDSNFIHNLNLESWYVTKTEGEDGEYINNLDNLLSPLQYQVKQMPTYSQFVSAFPKDNYPGYPGYFKQKPASQVYPLVGGNLENLYNTTGKDNGPYKNACTVRWSLGMNGSGFLIPNNSLSRQGANVNGQPRYYYIQAKTAGDFMQKTFGNPPSTHVLEGSAANDSKTVMNFLKGKTGIYVIVNNDSRPRSQGGAGYTGHVDLIQNGHVSGGSNHENVPGGIKYIEIWTFTP